MAKIGTFLLAEDLRDEGRGRYTAVGIYSGQVEFEDVGSAILQKSAILASIFDLSVGEYEFTLDMENQSTGNRLRIGSDKFLVEEDDTNFVVIARLEGLYFPRPGTHLLSISLNGDKIGEVEFGVNIENYTPPQPIKAKRRKKKKEGEASS